MKIYRVLSFFLGVFIFAAASAKPVENRIVYNFSTSVLNAYGVYKHPAETKSGLQAELEARKEGIRYASEQILKSCGENQEKLIEGWKNNFKSLGSIIYPKGVLEIELSAIFKEIFIAYKGYKVQIPKNADGDIIALKIPSINAAHVTCGLLKLKVDSNTTLYIAPIPLTQTDAPLIISSLSQSNSVLEFQKQDASLVSFFKEQVGKGRGTEKSPLALPIATK